MKDIIYQTTSENVRKIYRNYYWLWAIKYGSLCAIYEKWSIKRGICMWSTKYEFIKKIIPLKSRKTTNLTRPFTIR